MLLWIRKHSAEILLNIVAVVVFYWLVVDLLQQTVGYIVPRGWAFIPRYYTTNIIASVPFRDAGHWAIRFLVFSLAMTPLYIYANWRTALRLRKPAGLWAFAFASLHLWMYASDRAWGKSWDYLYIFIGVAAFSILAVLAITSLRLAMRLLGQNWKRLHRFVYIAAVFAVLHPLLSFDHWKKGPDGDFRLLEMRIYCVLVVILLLVRIPFVRTLLKRPVRKVKHQPDYLPVLD